MKLNRIDTRSSYVLPMGSFLNSTSSVSAAIGVAETTKKGNSYTAHSIVYTLLHAMHHHHHRNNNNVQPLPTHNRMDTQHNNNERRRRRWRRKKNETRTSTTINYRVSVHRNTSVSENELDAASCFVRSRPRMEYIVYIRHKEKQRERTPPALRSA